MSVRSILAWVAVALAAGLAPAADWPQWLGPNRDGKSAETGLLKQLPAGGPKLVWKVESLADVGSGYGTPAVVGDRLFILGGSTAKKTAVESCHCLDAKTGKLVWTAKLDTTPGGYADGWGGGPRGTPTVDGDKLYVLGATGDLACLAAADGAVVWRKNLVKDFGGTNTDWGYSESPLVDGGQVVVKPGGKGGVVALNKMSGVVIWQCKEVAGEAGYASCVPTIVGGVRQYVTQTKKQGVGVRAADGKLLWAVSELKRATAVIPTPVVTADGFVFFTAGYGAGCELVKLTPAADNGTTAELVYTKNKVVADHHGGVIEYQGKIYGHSDSNGWVCFDYKTGPAEAVWKSKELDKGSITYADGHFYGESKGTLVQIKATADGWQEVGRFTIPKLSPTRPNQGKVWSHPVVANGKLYLRDYEILYCYDIAAQAAE